MSRPAIMGGAKYTAAAANVAVPAASATRVRMEEVCLATETTAAPASAPVASATGLASEWTAVALAIDAVAMVSVFHIKQSAQARLTPPAALFFNVSNKSMFASSARVSKAPVRYGLEKRFQYHGVRPE